MNEGMGGFFVPINFFFFYLLLIFCDFNFFFELKGIFLFLFFEAQEKED